MMVNASSKRDTRWSKGKPKAAYSGLVPAGTQTKHEPATADVVDGGRLLRDHRRIVERGGCHEWPDEGPLGGLTKCGQQRPRLQRTTHAGHRIAKEEVVAYPYRVETDLLGSVGDLAHLPPGHLALYFGKLYANLHLTAHGCHGT